MEVGWDHAVGPMGGGRAEVTQRLTRSTPSPYADEKGGVCGKTVKR